MNEQNILKWAVTYWEKIQSELIYLLTKYVSSDTFIRINSKLGLFEIIELT